MVVSGTDTRVSTYFAPSPFGPNTLLFCYLDAMVERGEDEGGSPFEKNE